MSDFSDETFNCTFATLCGYKFISTSALFTSYLAYTKNIFTPIQQNTSLGSYENESTMLHSNIIFGWSLCDKIIIISLVWSDRLCDKIIIIFLVDPCVILSYPWSIFMWYYHILGRSLCDIIISLVDPCVILSYPWLILVWYYHILGWSLCDIIISLVDPCVILSYPWLILVWYYHILGWSLCNIIISLVDPCRIVNICMILSYLF